MLKIAICDDETAIVNQVNNLISEICRQEGISAEIQVFYGGDKLEERVRAGECFDIIYMDIQMNEGNGISAAESIRKTDEDAVLIYVSGYEKYMIELFRLDVFAFIRKPIDEGRFRELFTGAYERVCNKSAYFSYQYKSEEFKVLCKDILYFESEGRDIKIHTRDGEVRKFNGKISQVEERLQNGKIPFLRIHQSFLVNYHHIKSRSKSFVTIKGGVQLPISEDRRKLFGMRYGKLLEGEINV